LQIQEIAKSIQKPFVSSYSKTRMKKGSHGTPWNTVLRIWFANSLRTGRYTKYDILDEGKSTTFNSISSPIRSLMQYSLNFLCYIKLERKLLEMETMISDTPVSRSCSCCAVNMIIILDLRTTVPMPCNNIQNWKT
jgi:hypothetical protein